MKTYIIAEAGVNHNGSFENAFRMVDVAKQAGVDCIKFQTFNSKKLVSQYAPKANYQKNNTNSDESQLEMLKKLELSESEFAELSVYCRKVGIDFISTPFDMESIDFLCGLNIPFWKIPSGEITNYPYLVKLARTQKQVIMSTGMCTLEEIDEAIQVLKENGTQDITLLHCNTQYPTPYEDVNLLAMDELRERYNVEVGFSDHTLGIEVPVAAVAMGATVIEKHFTLDKNMEGPDHKASLLPEELSQMVGAIRNIEKALGTGHKEPSKSELENIHIARKSIVASCSIKKGEKLTEDNLTTKRPGNGISPMQWNSVLGTYAVRDFEEDEIIEI